jgi:uncharacterized protein YcbK (DUF882 family)
MRVWIAAICGAAAIWDSGTDVAADQTPARPVTPVGYFHVVRAWHSVAAGEKAPVDAVGRPMLVLHAMYVRETVALAASSDLGGFTGADRERATHALRDPTTGMEHPIAARTLDVLYRIQRRFNAPELRIMSAYRAPTPRSTQGLHGKGRAVDFVVPGAADEDVARFARQLGFVGVGLYPVGSFVHVDVRPRSYFWRDRSGPGHTSRERGILRDLAAHSDADARARGELPSAEGVAIGADVPTEEDEDLR